MSPVVHLLLRQLRAPMLVLIVAYAVAILGMVLMPGVKDDGSEWHMDFFHAFYFVSYMATTIGFGEIPYPFSAAQRLWAVISVYLTVVAWFYAIGKIVALVQDATLRQVFAERRFMRAVRNLTDPFYIVVGYGQTGALLVESLVKHGRHVVVVDKDAERINNLALQDLPLYVPTLCADPSLPDVLKMAGLRRPNCKALVALAGAGTVNLHLAISAKLLNPRVRVICRSESQSIADNMASFNTDHIIDPFDTFSRRLFTALHSPCLDTLYSWLTGRGMLGEPLDPPHGKWILCGYGRFGKALYRRLQAEGIETVVIEATPEKTGWPEGDAECVKGRGTEAVTLEEAGVREAVGIVAGTDDDTNNLSILMTAGMLNPDLFMVARQNRHTNAELFKTFDPDVVVENSRILADRIRLLLATPLLLEFLAAVRHSGERRAREYTAGLGGLLGEAVPEVCEISIGDNDTPAVARALRAERKVCLDDILRSFRDRRRNLPAVALFLARDRDRVLSPDGGAPLRCGDRLLFCGVRGFFERMRWGLLRDEVLDYLIEGKPTRTFLISREGRT